MSPFLTQVQREREHRCEPPEMRRRHNDRLEPVVANGTLAEVGTSWACPSCRQVYKVIVKNDRYRWISEDEIQAGAWTQTQ